MQVPVPCQFEYYLCIVEVSKTETVESIGVMLQRVAHRLSPHHKCLPKSARPEQASRRWLAVWQCKARDREASALSRLSQDPQFCSASLASLAMRCFRLFWLFHAFPKFNATAKPGWICPGAQGQLCTGAPATLCHRRHF